MEQWRAEEGVGGGGVDEEIKGEGGEGVRLDMEIKEVEIQRVVEELKNGKAGGVDGVVGEILRNGRVLDGEVIMGYV